MDKRTKALLVIINDPKIRAWLEANDPQALKQCMEAVKDTQAHEPMWPSK